MSLPPELDDALAEAAAARTLLVASDFDGVLSPLVQDPSASRPLPGTVESLRELAALPDTYAAVVSGRDLATLAALTGIDEGPVTLVGSHGAESSAQSSTETGDEAVSEEERTTLHELTGDLEELRDDLPDLRLESKPSAVVAHTRGMGAREAASAEERVAEVAAEHDGVRVMRGKHVVEMSVHDADKGTALADLGERVGADVLVYLGDDVTDEDVFTRMRESDVGVKVGDGDTAARHRVAEPQDAAAVLARLVELRRDR